MASGGYQQYSGNPYGQSEGGYGSNPYGGGYGASNPYSGGVQNDQPLNPPPALNHGDSAYSQGSQYSQPAAPPAHTTAPLSKQDFLARVEGAKSRINHLTSNIQEVASIHQRLLSSPDDRSSAQLESIITQTQIQNTQIKDEIKFLERDAAREPSNSVKKRQVENLKSTFKTQLHDFEREESDYSKRYREAISRQYKIVNPDATDQEVQEAANADWGNEGVFQQALKSNRSGQASSVLGAVRARHNDIQRIEKTLGELATLFEQLNEAVVIQDEATTQIEQQTERVNDDGKHAIEEIDRGIDHARRRRKLQWWTLLVVVLIIIVLALILGIYFGLQNRNKNNNNNQQ